MIEIPDSFLVVSPFSIRWDAMADQENHDLPTPNNNFPPRVGIDSTNVHESHYWVRQKVWTTRRSPSVSTLVDIYGSELAIYPSRGRHGQVPGTEFIPRLKAIECVALKRVRHSSLQWWLSIVAGFGWFRFTFHGELLPLSRPLSTSGLMGCMFKLENSLTCC